MPAETSGQEWIAYGDLAHDPSLHDAVAGCDAVIHCAGRAHTGTTDREVEIARRVNVDGTANLAAASAAAGVRRIVFMSSALVVAGSCDANGRVDDTSPVDPLTAYARIKADAEAALESRLAGSGTSRVTLRPPMVYGPGAPGNFHRLLRLVASGLPLPLGLATAPKSFIYVENLMSAVDAAVAHEGARNKTFLVADDELSSTAGLIRSMATVLHRPARLLPVPVNVLRALARTAGRTADVDSLIRPLAIDTQAIRSFLGWHPPVAQPTGIARTADAWQSSHALRRFR
jgi:nucleoside-diphosphate-sugar epimerase